MRQRKSEKAPEPRPKAEQAKQVKPRSVANVTLQVGLVSCPIKLYTIADPARKWPTMSSLCPVTRTKLSTVLVSDKHGQVERADALRGIETEEAGKFVVVPDDAIVRADNKAALLVSCFVPFATIPTAHITGAYVAGPGTGGDMSYAILAEALRRTRKAAIAEVVIRGKNVLCAITAQHGRLIVNTLLYGDAIRNPGMIDTGKAEPTEAMLEQAVGIIESMSGTAYDASQYRDTLLDEQLDAVAALLETKPKRKRRKAAKA